MNLDARALLAVFAGGGIGSVARYALTFAMTQKFGPGFPWATFAINVSGCLAIGIVSEVTQTRVDAGTPLVRLLLMTGVLGGYTTFSSFSLETLQLINERAAILAVAYVCGSVILGVIAAIAGVAFARIFL